MSPGPTRSQCLVRSQVRAALVALAAIAIAEPALAEPACEDVTVCGKREFDEGIAAYEKGQFGEAARHFESAQAYTPHPAILFNLALSEMERGNVSEAAAEFRGVIDDDRTDDKLRAKAREELALSESRCAIVTLDVPTGVTASLEIDGEPVVDVSSGVRVDPGRHWVKLVAGGRVTVDHSVSLEPGEHFRLAVEVKTSAPPPPPPVVVSDHRLPPAAAYVGAGITLVLTSAAVWSGLDTLSARDAYRRDLPNLTPEQAQARLDAGHNKELRTNVLIGSAVVGAAATVAVGWWLVDWGPREHKLSVGLAPTRLVVRGSF